MGQLVLGPSEGVMVEESPAGRQDCRSRAAAWDRMEKRWASPPMGRWLVLPEGVSEPLNSSLRLSCCQKPLIVV